jgi:hypothetical protein
MKFIKTFNESVRPYSYLKDGSLFKYVNMIDDFDVGRENFEQSEIEEFINLIKDWVYNFTSNTIIGTYKSKSTIEFQFNGKYVLYLNKYWDEYYLIKALLEIRGRRVPICVVVDSIDGIRMWSKTNPLEFIEETGSIKESVSSNLEDQFFKKIKPNEEYKFRIRHKEEPINKDEASKIVEILKEWNKKLMRYEDSTMLLYSRLGPRSFEIFIKKFEDEWFTVQKSTTEPQNWRNRRTGRVSLVETLTSEDYYLCDQFDGLIYLLEKIK